MTPSSKKITGYIDIENREWQSVLVKINELQKLNSKMAAYLEPGLTPYCQVANLTGNKLIMLCANGSIATQIRLLTYDLLKKFSLDPELKHIQQIACKLPRFNQPSLDTRSHQKKNMQPLSLETAEMIRIIAEGIEDKALREVMERIAGRTGR